jgi:hypothetical protein
LENPVHETRPQATPREIAFKLLNMIAERDPGSVSSKADIIETFSECLAAAQKRPEGVTSIFESLDDDVPF